MRKSLHHHLVSILLAIILVFTPVCTYASVDDNVGNSKLEILVGAPIDTEEPKTVFAWFRSIWSELLTITTTVGTIEGDINSLEEKVVALSSKIDSQTSTLNQKIDSQASALSSKIDAQTTTLSNKIGGISAGSSSKALPTGAVGSTFSLGGRTYVIYGKGSDYVRCAANIGSAPCTSWASAMSNTNNDWKNTLSEYYVVNGVSGPPTSASSYTVDFLNAFGGTIFYSVCYEAHNYFYVNGSTVDDWYEPYHGNFACIQFYTIYRK